MTSVSLNRTCADACMANNRFVLYCPGMADPYPIPNNPPESVSMLRMRICMGCPYNWACQHKPVLVSACAHNRWRAGLQNWPPLESPSSWSHRYECWSSPVQGSISRWTETHFRIRISLFVSPSLSLFLFLSLSLSLPLSLSLSPSLSFSLLQCLYHSTLLCLCHVSNGDVLSHCRRLQIATIDRVAHLQTY